MTPHQALKSLRKKKTLDEIRKLLAKKKIKTSVATLWRVLDDPKHAASHKLSTAIISLYAQLKKEQQDAAQA
jgi:hypothetical protein